MGVIAGPIALVGMIVTGTLWSVGWAVDSALGMASVLCVTAMLCGVGVLTLQGWCSGRGVATTGLLAACGAGLFFLSCPAYLELVGAGGGRTSELLIPLIVDTVSFVGVVIAAVATPIVIIELLLRWVSGGALVGCDGVFAVVRCVASLLVVGAALSLIQEEGLTRLLGILERMGS